MKGTYRYWRDGSLQAVVEPWELVRNREGLLLSGQRVVAGRPALEVEAEYVGKRCTALRLRWLASEPPRSAEMSATDDALLFPLLRAAAGPLVLQLAAGPRSVLLPNIRDAAGADFLSPLRSLRRTELQDAATQHYRYFGGEYGEAGADYWLDAQGLLLRYSWASPQGLWEARLENLEGAESLDWT